MTMPPKKGGSGGKREGAGKLGYYFYFLSTNNLVLVLSLRSQNQALYKPGVTLTKFEMTRCKCVRARS